LDIAIARKVTNVNIKPTNLKEIILHMILRRRQNFKFPQGGGNGQEAT
jgi:hypothetical protein